MILHPLRFERMRFVWLAFVTTLWLGLIPACLAEEGRPVFGTGQYVEYLPGALPVILGAPHGGTLKPQGVPDRTAGRVAQDSFTQEIARMIREEMRKQFGAPPHLVVCRLHRLKVDCNREIREAAQGNAVAETAHREFHGFITRAREQVQRDFGRGLYLDLHGHRHERALVEIGQLLTAAKLNLSDAELDAGGFISRQSSLRDLDQRSPHSFSDLVRGPKSLGGLLEARGIPSTPGPAHPSPGNHAYYNGAYDVEVHGSRAGGTVSAVQIEAPFKTVRDTPENRRRFAVALSDALGEYFSVHFGMPLGPARNDTASSAR